MRLSPFRSRAHPPIVTDEDFSYITLKVDPTRLQKRFGSYVPRRKRQRAPTITIDTSAASPSSPPPLPLSQNTKSRKRVAEPEEGGEHGGFGIMKRRRRIDTAGAGWQTAGSDHAKRQNRPQSISDSPKREHTMGYVRNVTEKIVTEELKASLAAFGQLIYFDINRGQNCAFVEYATPEGFQAALAANPHQVSGEPIYVEPRRPKRVRQDQLLHEQIRDHELEDLRLLALGAAREGQESFDSTRIRQVQAQAQEQQHQQSQAQVPIPNKLGQIQEMIFQILNQQTGALSGWQAGVRMQERMGLICNIIGNLRLASQQQPNPPILNGLIDMGTRFEKEIFAKSLTKEQYQGEIKVKLEQLMERRNQNQNNHAQAVQLQAEVQARAQSEAQAPPGASTPRADRRNSKHAPPPASQMPNGIIDQLVRDPEDPGTDPAGRPVGSWSSRASQASRDRSTRLEAPTLADNEGAPILGNRSRAQHSKSLSRPIEEGGYKLFTSYTISEDMTTGDESRSKGRLRAIECRKLQMMLR